MAEGSSWLIDAEIAVKADNLSAVGDAAEVEASRIGDLLKDLGGASKEADARSILSAYDTQISQSIRQLESLGKNLKVDETVARLRTLLSSLVHDVEQQFNVAFQDLTRDVESGGKIGGGGGGKRGGGGGRGGGEKEEVVRGGTERPQTRHADVIPPVPLPREARPLSALQLAQERARMQPAASGGLRADTAAVSALAGSVKPTVDEQKQVVQQAVAQVIPSVARERLLSPSAAYYHGTTAQLVPGTLITPAAQRPKDRVNYPGATSRQHVYTTPNEEHAWAYAVQGERVARDYARPRVYRVEATGALEQDPEFDKNGRSRRTRTEDLRSRSPLRVLGEVSLPRRLGSPAEWDQWETDKPASSTGSPLYGQTAADVRNEEGAARRERQAKSRRESSARALVSQSQEPVNAPGSIKAFLARTRGDERGSVMPAALFPGAGRALEALERFGNRQAARRDQVEGAMYDLQRGVASGEVDSQSMRSGTQGTIRKVTYADGTVAAVKTTPDNFGGHETVTKEVLSGLIAHAIGPDVAPAAAAIDRHTVASRFVPGQHLWTPRGTDLSDAIASQSGRKIALLDTLIGNNDRNPSNWILGQDNQPRGIDHGLASFGTLMGHRIGTSEFEDAHSGLIRAVHPFPQMPDVFTPGYGPNHFVRSDLEELAPRLASLRPQFEARDSGSWLDSAQGILRNLTQFARGTRRPVTDDWMSDPERGAINFGALFGRKNKGLPGSINAKSRLVSSSGPETRPDDWISDTFKAAAEAAAKNGMSDPEDIRKIAQDSVDYQQSMRQNGAGWGEPARTRNPLTPQEVTERRAAAQAQSERQADEWEQRRRNAAYHANRPQWNASDVPADVPAPEVPIPDVADVAPRSPLELNAGPDPAIARRVAEKAAEDAKYRAALADPKNYDPNTYDLRPDTGLAHRPGKHGETPTAGQIAAKGYTPESWTTAVGVERQKKAAADAARQAAAEAQQAAVEEAARHAAQTPSGMVSGVAGSATPTRQEMLNGQWEDIAQPDTSTGPRSARLRAIRRAANARSAAAQPVTVADLGPLDHDEDEAPVSTRPTKGNPDATGGYYDGPATKQVYRRGGTWAEDPNLAETRRLNDAAVAAAGGGRRGGGGGGGGGGNGVYNTPTVTPGEGDDPETRAAAHVTKLTKAADLLDALGENADYLSARLHLLIATARDTAEVFTAFAHDLSGAAEEVAKGDQAKRNFRNKTTLARLKNPDQDDIDLQAAADRALKTNRGAVILGTKPSAADTATDQAAALKQNRQKLAADLHLQQNQTDPDIQLAADRLRAKQANTDRINAIAGTSERAAARIEAQRLDRAENFHGPGDGIIVTDKAGVPIPTSQLSPQHREAAVRKYNQLEATGLPTSGMNLGEVQAALDQLDVEKRDRSRAEALARSSAGGGERKGFWKELVGASVSGAGGYRSASRLPPGALAGNALGALGRGAVGGVAFNAFFALQGGLQMALSSAMALDKQMAELKDTVRGVTGSTDGFAHIRDSILGISTATGVAGTQVAQLAQQFLGFTGSVSGAVTATKSVAEWIAVTGENAATAGPEAMTIMSNFGISAQQAGNAAISAGRAVGRQPVEIQQAVAGVAPVASEFGLTANQTYGLVAGVAKNSAFSGSDIGQGLGRIMENLPNQITAIERESNIRFKDPGNMKQDLIDLLGAGKLNPAVTETLGGAHNADLLAAAQRSPGGITALLSGHYTDTNALSQRNAAVQATLAESFAHLRTNVEAFASGIIGSGVGQMFADIANAGGSVVGFLATFAGYIGSLNSALLGIPGKFLELSVLIGGLNRLGAISAISKAPGALLAAASNPGATFAKLRRNIGSAADTASYVFASPTSRAAHNVTGIEDALVQKRTDLLGASSDAAAASIQKEIDALELQLEAERALAEGTALTTEQIAAQAAAQKLLGGAGAGGVVGGAAGSAEKKVVAGAESGAVGAGGIVMPALIAAAAGYAVVSGVNDAQNKRVSQHIATFNATLQDLTPAQVAAVAGGNTVTDPITGKPVVGSAPPIGYTAGFFGRAANWLSTAGGAITGAWLPGGPGMKPHAYLHASASQQIAAQQQVQEYLYSTGAASTSKGGPGNGSGANLSNVNALINAASGGPSGMDSNLQAALSTAQQKYQANDTAKNLLTLQQVYQRAAQTPAGQRALAENKVQADQTAAYQHLSDQMGVQFQSSGDITTAFQGGLINSAQALAAFHQIIGTDVETTQQGIAARRADQAALAQFTDQLTSSRLANQIAVANAIGGASPAEVLALTQGSVDQSGISAGEASNRAFASVAAQGALSQYDLQNAQSLGGTGQTTAGLIAAQTLTLTQGNAPVSFAAALDANNKALANDPTLTDAQLPYPGLGSHYSKAQIADQQRLDHEQTGTTVPIAVAQAQLEAAGAVPTGPANKQYFAKLTIPEKVSQIQAIAGEMQAQQASEIATAQNAGDDANTLAQMKVDDDQKTLAKIHDMDQAAGVSDSTSPAYIAAMQQFQDDTYSKLTTELSNLQTLGNLSKSKDFMSAIAQAQDDVNTAEKMRAALTGKEAGMSWAGLQAEADAGTISTAGEQALGQHDSGVQSTYQAGIGQIQGMSQVAQSLDFKDPRAQAADQIASAQKQAAFAGTSIATLQQQYQNGSITTAGLAILNQYTSGQQSAYQANMSQIQGVASVQKGMDFQSPEAQAQDDIKSAQSQASAAGTSIAALQAQFANGTINSAGLQILNQYVSAQQEVFQAIATTAQAQVALLQSQDIGNPLAQAQDAITGLVQQIDKQYGSVAKLQQAAKNPANVDAVNTLSQLNQANYAAFQAQQANIQGKYTAQEATATAVGNTPKAADEALAAAKQALSAFTKKFPKDANLNNSAYSALYANWQTAQGNALSATISYGTNLLQEEVANNQISIGQEIAGLKTLQAKARKAGDNAEVEALQTQIQQAINQGNANASFDLPAGLNIPTLYEARRSEGTRAGSMAGGGSNYYGNTGQVNVNININGNTDTTAAVNRISQAVGGSPTTGNNLPTY